MKHIIAIIGFILTIIGQHCDIELGILLTLSGAIFIGSCIGE